jgi:peptide subunit release factor 1 (eRF1)
MDSNFNFNKQISKKQKCTKDLTNCDFFFLVVQLQLQLTTRQKYLFVLVRGIF